MTKINPKSIVTKLVGNQVTHYVTLPDSETRYMYDVLTSEPTIELIPVSREGEAIPIAAGLHISGKKPVIAIQNSGLFESGDALRGLGLGIGLPLVMFIGYRGYNRKGDTPDTSAHFLEPFLHTWRVKYFLIESNTDSDRIDLAFETAFKTNQPVGILIGSEYEENNS